MLQFVAVPFRTLASSRAEKTLYLTPHVFAINCVRANSVAHQAILRFNWKPLGPQQAREQQRSNLRQPKLQKLIVQLYQEWQRSSTRRLSTQCLILRSLLGQVAAIAGWLAPLAGFTNVYNGARRKILLSMRGSQMCSLGGKQRPLQRLLGGRCAPLGGAVGRSKLEEEHKKIVEEHANQI